MDPYQPSSLTLMWLQSLSCLTRISDHLQIKTKLKDENADKYMNLWISLLKEMKDLGLDDKEEVRLGTIQTLFQSLEFYGHALDIKTWSSIIWDVLIPLLDSIRLWPESLTLVLESISNLFKNYLQSKIKNLSTFKQLWIHLLDTTIGILKNDNNKLSAVALKSILNIMDIFKQGSIDDEIWRECHKCLNLSFEVLKSNSEHKYSQEVIELLLKFVECVYDSQGIHWDYETHEILLNQIDELIVYPNWNSFRSDTDILVCSIPLYMYLIITY